MLGTTDQLPVEPTALGLLETSEASGAKEALRQKMLADPQLGQNGDHAHVVAYPAGDDGAFLSGTEIRVDGGSSAKGTAPAEVIQSGLRTDR